MVHQLLFRLLYLSLFTSLTQVFYWLFSHVHVINGVGTTQILSLGSLL